MVIYVTLPCLLHFFAYFVPVLNLEIASYTPEFLIYAFIFKVLSTASTNMEYIK